MPENLSYSVLAADLTGIMLIIILFFSNMNMYDKDKNMKIIFKLMLVVLLACLSDIIVYYVDSLEGWFYTLVIYITGSWLFIANVLTGYMWVKFLTEHLKIPFSKIRKRIYIGLIIFACILLFINLFYPLVFTAEGNVYQRASLYWVFVVIAGIYIIDGAFLYYRYRKRIGGLKNFPITIFLLPIIFGIIVQVITYEIAIIWSSVAIAIAGIIIVKKNELIFTDRLTGLYNRSYLDYIEQKIFSKKETVSGIMIDLDKFKSINDQYGHTMGDEALVCAASIFDEVFVEKGVVMRYAGDEFVVILKTIDKNEINQLIQNVREKLYQFNESYSKPFKLSASMGYAIIDPNVQNINEFMQILDSEMYKNKIEYYQSLEALE